MRHQSNGRPVEPVLAKRATLKTDEEAAVRIALVVRRAHSDFWCEGHLGDWDGHCGYCVLVGEGYVQSGDRRLCLACAEIEAKQVAVPRGRSRAHCSRASRKLSPSPLETAGTWDLCLPIVL